MAQAKLLIQALKRELKQQNKTYQHVAKHLNLSEASIKRMFANQEMSLSRIDAICQMLNIQLSDLLEYILQHTEQLEKLTRDQEHEIVSDRKLCLVTVCVVNHWAYNDILRFFLITEHELIQHLAKLDKLKIIDLLPGNKIKLLISPHFKWITNGPIEHFFQKYLIQDYINSNFRIDGETSFFQFGMLTKESSSLFKKKLNGLANEFRLMCDGDKTEHISKRFGNICFLMSKPWASSIFNDLIRPEIKDDIGNI